MAQPCRLIDLAGSPHDRGVQYGRQAAQEIARAVGHYGAQAKALGLDHHRLAQLVREYLPALETFDHRQIEEMRGIAAGAAVSFEQIVLVNARTELLHCARREPDGCTGADCGGIIQLGGALAAGVGPV